MTRLLSIAVLVTCVFGTPVRAVLVFDGIIDDVTVTRTDIGGGLESIELTVFVGPDLFDTVTGGFVPLLGFTFNQSFTDATPSASAFSMGSVPPDDTTFLVTRDLGDPFLEGANTDTTSRLSTPFISFSPLKSGTFGLAQLVTQIGGDAAVIGDPVGSTVRLVREGIVVGTISGTTVPIPEASAVAAWLLLAGGAVLRRKWDVIRRLALRRGEP